LLALIFNLIALVLNLLALFINLIALFFNLIALVLNLLSLIFNLHAYFLTCSGKGVEPNGFTRHGVKHQLLGQPPQTRFPHYSSPKGDGQPWELPMVV